MSAEVFLDTNVLLYSISKSPAEAGKQRIADALASTPDFGVSAQVCQEFIAVAGGKMRRSITAEETRAFVAMLLEHPFVPTDAELIRTAMEIQQRFQVSYWDAAILAAAQRLGAKTIYSEDLSHGQQYGSVQVVNPFLAAKPA